METSTWIYIGLGVAAVGTIAGVGIYEHKKHAQPSGGGVGGGGGGGAAVTAPKPYTAVGSMVGGNTYLVSFPGISGVKAADEATAINLSPDALVSQSWDVGVVPPGWPSDDQGTDRQRFVVALAQGGVPPKFPSGVKLYQAGQSIAASSRVSSFNRASFA